MKPSLTETQKRFVHQNIGLAYEARKRLRDIYSDTLDSDDILSACFEGLVGAAIDYNPSKGEFSTHANWRMRGSVMHLAEREARCKYLRRDVFPEFREESQVGPAIQNEAIEVVRKAIAKLPKKEAVAVTSLELKEETLAQCGKKLGMSYEAARQYRDKGLDRLVDLLVGVDL